MDQKLKQKTHSFIQENNLELGKGVRSSVELNSYCLFYTRCHQNQRDHIEQTDLEYLSRKIRDKEVETHLARLLQAICNRELNF